MRKANSAGAIRQLVECERRDKTPGRWLREQKEALDKGEMKPEDYSIRQLFEALVEDDQGNACGREIVDDWNPNRGPQSESQSYCRLVEAGAIKSAAFSNISGQLIYSKIMEAYQQEEFAFSKMIPSYSTMFNGEKIPGIGGIGDKAQIVPEMGVYPLAGVTEDWVETPQTTKRGIVTALTKEAIFFDRTGLLLREASAVGEALGLNKEKRAIDCVIDENTTAHRYNRKSLGAIATYGENSGTHDFDNLQTSNGLVDWTDLDNVEQLLSAMVDPNTGEPIILGGTMKLILTRGLLRTAERILTSTQLLSLAGGYVTNAATVQHVQDNPYKGKFEIMSTQQLAARLGTDTSWFWGDPTKAFSYAENWPMTTVQAPTNSEAEFTQDIVQRYKSSERGAFVTENPRYMIKSTVA